MTDIFHINWQDPVDRRWFTVARLVRTGGHFVFGYTQGALRAPNFHPFAGLTDQKSVYVSNELFPIFANRVMSERRPEYARYAAWSGMADGPRSDPLLLMARMGGGRATDTLQVYPVPARSIDGRYKTVFFCHGIRHMAGEAQSRSLTLVNGERLFPLLDVQNPFDAQAVALRTSDPASIIGYCPRYVAKDMTTLGLSSSTELEITVKQVNLDAPPQFRVLCEANARWPAGFWPCDDDECRPLVDINPAALVKRVSRQNREERKSA